MTVAELPGTQTEHPRQIVPEPAAARLLPHAARSVLTLEWLLWGILIFLTLLTRFWELDNRALHHDETLHAQVSHALYAARGYVHDPLLHGPFLYHINAFFYLLFGASDATARYSAALFGSTTVILPLLLRRQIGRGGALAAATLLLISPIFLYVNRFLRHDAYAVFCELLAIVAFVRFLTDRRPFWLYVLAAALGIMFVSLETFYLYLTILGPVAALVFFGRVWRPGLLITVGLGLTLLALLFVLPGHAQRPFPESDSVIRAGDAAYICPSADNPIPVQAPMAVGNYGPVFGWGPLATADNNYALCVRHQPDNNFGLYVVKLAEFVVHPAITSAIIITLATLIGLYWAIWRRHDANGVTAWQRAAAHDDTLMRAFSAAAGWPLVIAAAIFLGIHTLFFTAFFTNPTGVVSGFTGSLLYWLAQHEVKRGGQPAYYYVVQLGIYEQLMLLWWLIGGGVVLAALVQRVRARRLLPKVGSAPIDWQFWLPLVLLYWSLGTLAIYSWAGEKMPWLTIHTVLPFTMLAGWALARTVGWWHAGRAGQRSDHGALALVLVGVTIIAALALVYLVDSLDASVDATPWFMPYVLPYVVALLGLGTLAACLVRGPRWGLGSMAIAMTLVLALFTVRNAYRLSFINGDNAREMMVYVQTTPDVTRVVERLALASTRRGGGMDMPIWYDNETVWDWYMIPFSRATEQPATLAGAPPPEVQAVLLLQENIDGVPGNRALLDGMRIQRYPLRWWFPEDQMYRLPKDWTSAAVTPQSPLLMQVLRTPFASETARSYWQYMLFRELPYGLGSSDFIIAARPDLAQEIGIGTGGK